MIAWLIPIPLYIEILFFSTLILLPYYPFGLDLQLASPIPLSLVVRPGDLRDFYSTGIGCSLVMIAQSSTESLVEKHQHVNNLARCHSHGVILVSYSHDFVLTGHRSSSHQKSGNLRQSRTADGGFVVTGRHQ